MINAPRADRPTYWQRTRDMWLVGVITALLGAVVGHLLGQVRLRVQSRRVLTREMSHPGLTVLCTNKSLICFDVTVTVDRDGGRFPDPSEFAAAATRAAEARSAETMSAHTAKQIISVVTVPAASRPEAVALAIVSEALRCSAPSR